MNAAFVWGVATDAGRVREKNEDCVFARPPVFLVADGMGGHADGEIASSLAVEEFAKLAARDALTRDDVAAAIDRANRKIVSYAADHAKLGMGTTVSGVALSCPGGVAHWLVFNVGDSRVYRYDSEGIEQMTHDHSEVQELVDTGQILADEARHHRLRSVVTRALGSDPAPDIDMWLLPMVQGERLMICSDGLVAELSDRRITESLGGEPPAVAAETLVRNAVDAGGRDNVSVIVVDVSELADGGAPDEDTKPRQELTSGSGR